MSIVTLDTTAADLSAYQVESSSSETNLVSEDFLKLLLVQLENQDPLDPIDAETFTSQLCSLSQLEQATITNGYLEDLLSYETSGINSQAVNYIGKSIDIEGNTLSVTEGCANDMTFELADDASEVNVTIYDDEGNDVWSEDISNLSSGTHYLSLDEDDIDDLGDGDYTFEVTAYDSSGESIETTTYTTAAVTGVVYEDGVAYLVADGRIISLDDVTRIYQS